MNEPKKDIYADSWDQLEHRKKRSEEALRQLQSIHANMDEKQRAQLEMVLEIGSGVGGVTQALREFFPNAHIYAVDRDPQAATVQLGNNTEFKQADILALSDEDLAKVLENVHYISALRTAGPVALDMLKRLDKVRFTGKFVFSIIFDTDVDLSRMDIRNAIGNHPFRATPMSQMRGHDEIAYEVTF